MLIWRIAVVSIVALGVVVGLPGCYLAHDLAALDEDSTPSLPDAGVSPMHGDAGSPPRLDAGAVRRPEPEPDLGPDSRPSDYPDADEWEEPPDLAEDDPCCELDEPIQLSSRHEGLVVGSELALAWGPGRWGLLTTRELTPPRFEHDPRPMLFELAANGAPHGPPRVLDRSIQRVSAIRWAEGRWAIVVSAPGTHEPEPEWHARLFDRDLRDASEWIPVGRSSLRQIALARLTSGDRWLAVRVLDGAVALSPFSDRGADAPVARVAASGAALEAVGMRSRIVVLVGNRFSEDDPRDELVVVGAAPGYAQLATARASTSYEQDGAIAALRDLVVTAGFVDGEARAEVFDPFTMTMQGEPRSLGVATDESSSYPRRIDVVGSSKHGVAGVCWGTGAARGHSGIEFRLVGPDGVPRGRAVRIVEGTFRRTLACAVGADDDGFLVAWSDGEALWVRRIHVAR